MKLLVVEDEPHALEGLVRRLDTQALGVSGVATAVDGDLGFQVAESYRPDILLSDVRMPRADGLAMARRIRMILPQIKVIFMSGYADKEYLLEAIDLGAIRYIEKPVRIEEVRLAIGESIRQLSAEQRTRDIVGASIASLESELALRLCECSPNEEMIRGLLAVTMASVEGAREVVTVWLRIGRPAQSRNAIDREAAVRRLRSLLAPSNLKLIAGCRPDGVLVFHMYADPRAVVRISPALVKEELLHLRGVADLRFSAGIGPAVSSLKSIAHSAAAAECALESAFFGEGFGIAHREQPDSEIGELSFVPRSELEQALATGNESTVDRALSGIETALARTPYPSVDEVKKLVRRIATGIQHYREEHGLRVAMPSDSWEEIEGCTMLGELIEVVRRESRATLSAQKEVDDHGRVVAEIRRLIAENFADPLLSVESIARSVRRSTPYVCTRFRAATGKTINGYLTEVRLIHARELLGRDRGPSVAEVADRVGWSNADYFARVFRKSTGQSPSEYRARSGR